MELGFHEKSIDAIKAANELYDCVDCCYYCIGLTSNNKFKEELAIDYTWIFTLEQWEDFSSSITDSQMIKSILKIGGSIAIKNRDNVIFAQLRIDKFDKLTAEPIS